MAAFFDDGHGASLQGEDYPRVVVVVHGTGALRMMTERQTSTASLSNSSIRCDFGGGVCAGAFLSATTAPADTSNNNPADILVTIVFMGFTSASGKPRAARLYCEKENAEAQSALSARRVRLRS
jgi:hypothetical protein